MKRNKLTALLSAAGIALSAVSVPVCKVQAAEAEMVPLYRTYNPNSGEHFYTTNYAEALNTYKSGWVIEGTGWMTPSKGEPVYRLFNPNSRDAGSHYYTARKAEADYLASLGWRYDNSGNPVFYSGGDLPIYVQYNPNDSGHNYTPSKNEADTVVAAGWQGNGIGFYCSATGSEAGARPQLKNVSTLTVRHKVDSGERDVVPAGSWRTLHPNNCFPEEDITSVPEGKPDAVLKGTINTSTYSSDPKYALSGYVAKTGYNQGCVGIGFQKVATGATKDFGEGQISMLIFNFMADATNDGQQYYVTVNEGVNQDLNGTNDIEIDYYIDAQTAVFRLNGKLVVSLKTKIKLDPNMFAMVFGDDGNGKFTATAPNGEVISWTGDTSAKGLDMD